MKSIRAWLRLSFFFPILFLYIVPCVVNRLIRPGNYLPLNMVIRQKWCRVASRLMGIKATVVGLRSYQQPVLFVSNHRSFLDPMVILQYIHAFPLAKAEVSKYPLIGFGAKATGILFVKRQNPKSRFQAKNAMEETLENGHHILIFPEGTTSDEAITLPFKNGAFEVADDGFAIVPLLIRYRDKKDHWTGSSLFQQYMYTCAKPRIECSLTFGNPIAGKDYRVIKENTEKWFQEQLGT